MLLGDFLESSKYCDESLMRCGINGVGYSQGEVVEVGSLDRGSCL